MASKEYSVENSGALRKSSLLLMYTNLGLTILICARGLIPSFTEDFQQALTQRHPFLEPMDSVGKKHAVNSCDSHVVSQETLQWNHKKTFDDT